MKVNLFVSIWLSVFLSFLEIESVYGINSGNVGFFTLGKQKVMNFFDGFKSNFVQVEESETFSDSSDGFSDSSGSSEVASSSAQAESSSAQVQSSSEATDSSDASSSSEKEASSIVSSSEESTSEEESSSSTSSEASSSGTSNEASGDSSDSNGGDSNNSDEGNSNSGSYSSSSEEESTATAEAESNSTAIATVESYNVFTNVEVDSEDKSALIIQSIYSTKEEIMKTIAQNAKNISKTVKNGVETTLSILSDLPETISKQVTYALETLDLKEEEIMDAIDMLDEIAQANLDVNLQFQLEIYASEYEELVDQFNEASEAIERLNLELIQSNEESCEDNSDCSSCTLNEECGWCAVDQKCHYGSKKGPAESVCSLWSYGKCPSSSHSNCKKHSTCSSCLQSQKCGWCENGEDDGYCTNAEEAESTCESLVSADSGSCADSSNGSLLEEVISNRSPKRLIKQEIGELELKQKNIVAKAEKIQEKISEIQKGLTRGAHHLN